MVEKNLDFNAQTGTKIGEKLIRSYGKNIVNKNAERIIDFSRQNTLKITNGHYKHKNIH